MASVVLRPPFPPGTNVAVYPAAARIAGQGPSGPSLASGQVDAGGMVLLDVLPDDASLVAYAVVNGENRYLAFHTDPPPASVARGLVTGLNRGQWAPLTDYYRNDIVYDQGGWYSANQDFRSTAGFDAANWTQISGIPAGGAIGLFLSRDTNGDPVWAPPVSPDVAGKEDKTSRGVANGYASLGADGKIPAGQLPASSTTSAIVLPFSVPGDLAVGVGQTRLYIPNGGTLQSVEASVGTASGGQAVIPDVNRNGTSVFSTQANRPSIAPGAFTSGKKTPNVTTLTAGDYLTVDIDQVGITVSNQPTFLAATGAGQSFSFNTGSYDVIKPTNLVTGDLILVTLRIGAASLVTVTPPAGFTAFGTPRQASATLQTFQFWKIDDGTAGPYTFNFNTLVSSVTARRALFHNVHPTAPIDSESSAVITPGATSHPVAALTTVNANALLYLEFEMDTSVSATLPAGYTSLSGWGTSTSATFATEQMGAAGAADAPTIVTAANTASIPLRVAVRPNAGSGPAITGKDLTVVVRYVEA